MLAIAVTSTTPTAVLMVVAVTISLMIPCLAGEKMAHCSPSKKRQAAARYRLCRASAPPIMAMIAICAQRLSTMTCRLEKRSEIHPAMGAKRMKGSRMIAARIVLVILALATALPGKSSGATAKTKAISISLAALSFSKT